VQKNKICDMQRSNIKIDNSAIIAYCKREHGMQGKVYPRLVTAGKMDQYRANQNYCIITELKEVAQALEQKGYSWQELRKIVEDLPGRKVNAEQQTFW
jgi:hypothetical protein